MKLRNKKTGEIVDTGKEPLQVNSDGRRFMILDKVYDTLAELNEEWEDYEEPKYDDEWIISCGRYYIEPVYAGFTDETLKRVDELGLLYKNKEEAEKAVEKLKAWKRLKDKGFRFDGWQKIKEFKYGNITFGIDDNTNGEDLDLLFGGEE